MSDEVIKVLDDLGRRFGIAVDWSNQNVIPYLKELSEKVIKYEIATSVFWIVLCTALMLLILHYGKKAIIFCQEEYKKNCYSSYDAIAVILVIVEVIAVLICTGVMLYQMYVLISCLVFPEKVLLDFVNSYM